MPPVEILLTFAIAALVMNLSPGPSNLYVIARATAGGTSAGIVAAVGLGLGSMVHVLATALGISALFAHWPAAYSILKVVGATYLIWLGIRYFATGAQSQGAGGPRKRKGNLQILRESTLIEISNPKTGLFFLALLPQFAVPEAGPMAPQLLLLGFIVTASAIPCDILVAFASGRAAGWLSNSPRARALRNRVTGSILVGLGGYILFEDVVD